jgi:hypothetical protein
MLLTKQERKRQEKLAARLQAMKNAEKSKHVVKAGANLPSQWGKVVANEQRLIDNGHFMKTSERAQLDYYREQYRKAKKAQKSDSPDVILVKKV